MQITEMMFEKLKSFEGCRLQAYQDAAKVWTIGYGRTKGVKKNDKITQEKAEEYLREDVEEVEGQILALNLNLTQPQFDALTSFVYNVGIGAFKKSTLLRFIREGRSENDIKKQFYSWVYSNGRTLPGLVKRREWEAIRFFSLF